MWASSKNKFGNKKVKVGDITFASKKEYSRYYELKLLEKAKVISNLQFQVKFEILPKQKDERSVKYIADFVYIENGKTVVEDSKGYRTKEYIIKRKLFKYKYPNYKFIET